MTDTSESEVGEISQCPNLTLILNKARGKVDKDDNIIADSVETLIKGKYRKSIVKRAVQPALVCSTPFTNQNGDLHSFSNFSTLSQQSENLKNVEEISEPVGEEGTEQIVTGREKSVVDREKIDIEKTLITKEASVIREVTSDSHGQRSVIGKTSVSVGEKSVLEENAEKSHASSLKKSLLAEISDRSRVKNEKTPTRTGPTETHSVVKETTLVQNSRENGRLETDLKQNDRHIQNCSKVSAKLPDKSAYSINKRRKSNESTDESLDDDSYYQYKSKYRGKKAGSPKKIIVVKHGEGRNTNRRSRSRVKKSVKYVYVSETSEEESDFEEMKKKKKKRTIRESPISESYSSSEIVVKRGHSKRKQSVPPRASHHKNKRYDSPRGRSVSRKRQIMYIDSGSPHADRKLKKITGQRRSRSYHKIRKSRKIKVPSSESEIYEHRTRKYNNKSSKKKYRREVSSSSSFEEDDYVERIPEHRRQNERTERYSYRPRSKIRVTEFKKPRTTHIPGYHREYSHGRGDSGDVESDNYRNKGSRLSKRETHILDKKKKVNKTDRDKNKQPIFPFTSDATESSNFPQVKNYLQDILEDYTLRIKQPGPSDMEKTRKKILNTKNEHEISSGDTLVSSSEEVSTCDKRTFPSQKAIRKLSKNPTVYSELAEYLPRDKSIRKKKTNLNKRSLLDIVNTLSLKKARTANMQNIAVQTSQNNVLTPKLLSTKDIISISDNTSEYVKPTPSTESTKHKSGAKMHFNKSINVQTDSPDLDPNIIILQNVTVQKADNPTKSEINADKKKSIKTKIPIATKERQGNHVEDVQANTNDTLYQKSPEASPQNFTKPDRRSAKNKRTLPCTKLDFGDKETEEVDTSTWRKVDESKPNDEDPKLLETTTQELQIDEIKLSAEDEEEKDIHMISDDDISNISLKKSSRISGKTESESNFQRDRTYRVSPNSSPKRFPHSPKNTRNSLVKSDTETGESNPTRIKSLKGKTENIKQENVLQLDRNGALSMNSSSKSLEQSPRDPDIRRRNLRSMTSDKNDTETKKENTKEQNELKNDAMAISSLTKIVLQSPTVPKTRKNGEKSVNFVENETGRSSPTRKKNTKQEKIQDNDIQLNTDEDMAENSSSHIFLKPKEVPKRSKRSVSSVSCVGSGISIDVTQYQKKKTTTTKIEKNTGSQSNEFLESGFRRPTRNRKPLKIEEKICLSSASSQDLIKQYQKLTGISLSGEKPEKKTRSSKTEKDASNVVESSSKKSKISNSGNKIKVGRPRKNVKQTSEITENTADVESRRNVSENVEDSNGNNTETISESVIENTDNEKTSHNLEESRKNVRGVKKNISEHTKNVLRSTRNVTKSISHFMEPSIDDIEPTLSLAEVSVEVSEFLENINMEINEAASDTTDRKAVSGIAEPTVKVAESPSEKSKKNTDGIKKKDETLRNYVTKASSTGNTTNVQDMLSEMTTEEVNVAESVKIIETAPIKKQVKKRKKKIPLNCPQPKKKNNTSKKVSAKKKSTTDNVGNALKRINASESNTNLAEDEPQNSPAENLKVPVKDGREITVQKENSPNEDLHDSVDAPKRERTTRSTSKRENEEAKNDVGSSPEIPVREDKKRKKQKKNSTKDLPVSKKKKTSKPTSSDDAAGSTDDALEYTKEWEKISMKINQLGQNDTEMYEVTDLHGYVALAPRRLVYYVNEKYKQIFRRIEGTNSIRIGDLFLTHAPPLFIVPKGVAVGIANTGTGRVLLSYILSEN